MICVTLGHPTHAEMIAAHRALAAQGAELVELRIDLLREEPGVPKLLAERPTRAIVTCRRPEDGGQYHGSEEARRALLQQAIDAGAEYVDLELDTARAMPRAGMTRRIVSYHNFDETPSDLETIHADLAAADADVVKLATIARSPSDNVRMLELVAESEIPTAGFCMGETGLPTRVLARKYGAPFTYAAPDEASAVAPGQLSFAAMRDLYRYDGINRDTQLYGVIADPVGHSLSPLIHNTAFRELGLNSVYLPFRVSAEQLEAFLEGAGWLQVRGLSVTIPHKEAITRFLADADKTVHATGAANTVLFDGAKLHGYNTDGPAAMESLLAALPAAADRPLAGKHALLLGAGGAARAVAHGLKRSGADVTVTGRTAARAELLARRLGCQTVPWERRSTVEADILGNCTPLGMAPDTEASPLAAEALKHGMIVFDTVYNPEQTRLLREAAARGCIVVSGREMFVRQAAAQFRLFTGQEPPLDCMRQTVHDALANP
jgi:3-dehydroquinate dehydratase/shikimate dehydrogenase